MLSTAPAETTSGSEAIGFIVPEMPLSPEETTTGMPAATAASLAV